MSKLSRRSRAVFCLRHSALLTGSASSGLQTLRLHVADDKTVRRSALSQHGTSDFRYNQRSIATRHGGACR